MTQGTDIFSNMNKPTITQQEHMWWMVGNHFNSLLEISRLHRSIHQKMITELLLSTEHDSWRVYRDFCTVALRLPRRSGLTTWAKSFLTEQDLLISRNADPECQARTVRFPNNAISQIPEGFVARYIVIDDAQFLEPSHLVKCYQDLGKDPITQTFILLG